MVVIPDVEIIQQSLSINPSGSRHLKSGAAGFLKELNTAANGVLDFGSVNTTNSGVISDTKLIYARVNSFGDASGVYNMKLFWASISDLNTGTYRFLRRQSLHFQPNISLSEADLDLPVIVPEQANVSGTSTFSAWQHGKPYMSGIFDDDATMYQYMAILVGTDVPIGQKGGPGAGSLRARLQYDFS